MEYWKRNRVIKFTTKPPLSFYFLSIFFFFFSISALFFTISSSTTCPDSTCNLSAKVDAYFQELDQKPIMKKKMMTMLKEETDEKALRLLHSRRYLSGPGSSPPRCTSKCGSCTPCKPVHVPVPPGTPVTAEYYPEAWRCKCGNKLYMP